jgi:hypothetical protein
MRASGRASRGLVGAAPVALLTSAALAQSGAPELPLPRIATVESPGCLESGAELSVHGLHLGSERRGWSLELVPGASQEATATGAGVQLEVEEWTEQRIRARVPLLAGAGLARGAGGVVRLLSASGGVIGHAPNALRVCPAPAASSTVTASEAALLRGSGLRRAAPQSELPVRTSAARRETVAGALLVAVPDAATAADIKENLGSAELIAPLRLTEFAHLGFTLVELLFADDETAGRARAALERRYPQLRIVPNRVFRPELSQRLGAGPAADPRRQIGWPTQPRCGRGLRIGMIDTGVDLAHLELADAEVTVLPVGLGEPLAADALRHGTRVASLLVGRSLGLLPEAHLFAVAAFWEEDGDVRSHTPQLLAGIDWLLGERVSVINLSLTGTADELAADALRRAHALGIQIVAAVGNHGSDKPVAFPASLREVVAVTAVDIDGSVYPRATRGSEIALAAPGVDVPVADPPRGLGIATGTSYAAPFVTAALALAPQGLAHLRHEAQDLGERGPDPVFGWGLLDASGLCPQADR